MKLLENIFRSVNIALVNELAQLCDRMRLDVWEVVEAAATKPFGFMRFKPGPGLGGHCLPVDPFYLAWKAREFDFYTEFIELAGKINENMPYFCLRRSAGRSTGSSKSRQGSRVHLLGVSYKAERRRPARVPRTQAVELLRDEGADRLLLRPARAGAARTRSRPRSRYGARRARPTASSSSRRTAASTTTTLAAAARLVVDFRNATGVGGSQRQGVEAVAPPSRARASGRGDPTSPATSTSSPGWPGSATRARSASRGRPRATRRPVRRPPSTSSCRTRRSRRWSSPRRSRRTRSWRGAPSSPASMSSSRSRWRWEPRTPRAWWHSRRSAASRSCPATCSSTTPVSSS